MSLFGAYYPPDTVRAILGLIRPALRRTSAGTRPGPARPGPARPGPAQPELAQPGFAQPFLRTGFSRAGGPPLLPPDTTRPTWAGRPLDFLAVIDFAEMAGVLSLPELPAAGTAYFYYAAEIPRPWGDDPAQREGWRVLSCTPADAIPIEGGNGISAGAAEAPAVPLSAEPFLSLPGPYEPSLRTLDATWSGFLDVYEQLYEAWLRFAWADLPRHQLAGWPVLVQRSLGEDQRLLLQLDSDERLGRCWGDPGTVYFHTRAADLSRGALDRCRLTLQAR
jgi:hypothetical protein